MEVKLLGNYDRPTNQRHGRTDRVIGKFHFEKKENVRAYLNPPPLVQVKKI